MDKVKTPTDIKNEEFFVNKFKNIIKVGDHFELQDVYRFDENHNSYNTDEDKANPAPDFADRPNCESCFNCFVGGHDYFCWIYHHLSGRSEFDSNPNRINKCDAYEEVKPLYYCRNIYDMLLLIHKTRYHFDSVEDWFRYYGFELKDDENGRIIETLGAYVDRGGTFTNGPTQYPAVVFYDLNHEKNTAWIGIPKPE